MTRIRTDVRWSMVPEWVSDHEQAGLSHAAVRLYAILMRYANSEGEGAVPARATLARRMGLKTTDRVDAAKKELVAAGALEEIPRPGKPNEYRLHQVPRKLPRVENSVGTLPRKLGTNENQNESTPSGVRSDRSRDPVFDSLVERFGDAPQGTARGAWNTAVRSLKADGWDGHEPSLAELERGYRKLYGDVALTPTALAKHYTLVKNELGGAKRAAAAACPDCGIGGGLHVADCPRVGVAA